MHLQDATECMFIFHALYFFHEGIQQPANFEKQRTMKKYVIQKKISKVGA
jgi:hypothetical protein